MARVLSMTTRLAHRNKDALKPHYLKLADGALAEGSAQLMQAVTVGALYDALTVRLHWPTMFLKNLIAYLFIRCSGRMPFRAPCANLFVS